MITSLKNLKLQLFYLKQKLQNSAAYQKYSIIVFCFLCFAAVTLLQIKFMMPLDKPLYGHDMGYHLLRTEALKQRIEDMNFFNGGIDYLFYNGAGYASSLAYPDMLLYIPALLRIAGVGIGLSMSIFLIICSILSYISMFICVRKISGSPVCGTIAAVISSLSQYRLDNMFTRFALGEIQAYIFWPIIIYGLYDLIFEDFKKPYVLGIGIAGMLLTHTVSTALALGLCVIYVLLFIKRLIKCPKKFIKLGITALIVVAITSFYWIPLLEFMASCDLTVAHPRNAASQFVGSFINLFKDIQLMYSDSGMGIVIFMLCIPRIALCKKSPIYKSLKISDTDKKRPKLLAAADSFMIIGFLLCIAATDIAPWKILAPILDFLQYPYRLFALATALIAIAAAIFIYCLTKFTHSQKTGMVIVTIATVIYSCIHIQTIAPFHLDKLPDNHFDYSENTFDISYGEWLPWATQINIDYAKTMTDKLVLNNGQGISFGRYNGYLEFILPEEGADYADVPFIWYKGYTAVDETGKELEISMSDIGFVRVDTSNAHGKIKVQYKITPLKIISYFITLAAIIVLVIMIIRNIIRRKKKRNSSVTVKTM